MIPKPNRQDSPSLKRKATASHICINAEDHQTARSEPRKRQRHTSCWHSGRHRQQSTATESASHTRLTKSVLRKFNKERAQFDTVDAIGKQDVEWLVRPIDEFLGDCDTETLKGLRAFASDGGPDILDLRGCKKQHLQGRKGQGSTSTSETKSSSEETMKSSGSSGPRSPRFEQKLADGGVYNNCSTYPDGRRRPRPANWESLKELLYISRPPNTPPLIEEDFCDFEANDECISDEAEVVETLLPIISGEKSAQRCCPKKRSFTNFVPLLKDEHLSIPQPDVYYGSAPHMLQKQVRAELSGFIVPCKKDTHPMLPNFFIEAKGPEGHSLTSRLQACYAGAVGARAMHHLRTYINGEENFDDEAYTITAIITGSPSILELFTCHITESTRADGSPEYHMNKLGIYALTKSSTAFQEGVTAFRNARDWAKLQREELIRLANARFAVVEANLIKQKQLHNKQVSNARTGTNDNNRVGKGKEEEEDEDDEEDDTEEDGTDEDDTDEEDTDEEVRARESEGLKETGEEAQTSNDRRTTESKTQEKRTTGSRTRPREPLIHSDGTDELATCMNRLTPTKQPPCKRTKNTR